MGEKLHFLSKHSEIFCFEYTGEKCQGTNLSASFFFVCLMRAQEMVRGTHIIPLKFLLGKHPRQTWTDQATPVQ